METQSKDEHNVHSTDTKIKIHETLECLLEKYYSIVDETSPEFQEELSTIHTKYESKFQTLNNLEQRKLHQVLQEALFRQQIFNEN